jgi:hypothetical protein
MLRREVLQRDLLPLGDASWTGSLLPARAPREELLHAG